MQRNSKKRVIVDAVTHVSQTHAVHTMAWQLRGSKFQEGEHAERSTLSTLGSNPLVTSSRRATITVTIIGEEAAESFLAGIQGDAELASLVEVLNRYPHIGGCSMCGGLELIR
jgi:hypothetical protein